MASGTANSSWHPAFMPNTSSDPVSIRALESLRLSALSDFEGSKANLIEPICEPEFANDTRQTSKDLSDEEPKSERAELTDLRDALTTSLASPGGVEMEENPLHKDVTFEDGVGSSLPESTKAEFPSEAPTNESKHQSTTSFARTVSHEFNWAEDDEVDPEWHLPKPDTDPFKHMAKFDRTNSFPAVPPTHFPGSLDETSPLAHSQAEEIMESIPTSHTDVFSGDTEHEDSFFAQQSSSPQDDEPSVTEAPRDSLDHTQVYGGGVKQEADEEDQARFEEGVPLVNSQDEESLIPKSSDHAVSAFTDDGGDDDFFAQVDQQQSDDQTFAPAALTRKSTTDVINSLDFQPHVDVGEGILEEDEDEAQNDDSTLKSPLEKLTGGGVGASKSTILSEVLGDLEGPLKEETVPAMIPNDEDEVLAAKWKAALEEDEFLDDDDELLEDDTELESKPLDPSAFFGSDDEGFLEDTDDLNGDFLGQTSESSPLPVPVHGTNGEVVGFNKLTGSASANQSRGDRYTPTNVQTNPFEKSMGSYTPTAPLLTDLSQPNGITTIPSSYASSPNTVFSAQAPQVQRQELHKAQSFADKAKGGYASPYDLPMDVVKPRKRASMQPTARSYSAASPVTTAPPPRSSSTTGQILPPRSVSSMSPTINGQGQSTPMPGVAPAGPILAQSNSAFFEDLPLSSKPRSASRQRFAPTSPALPGLPLGVAPPANPYAPQQQAMPQQPFQNVNQPPVNLGLVAPERSSPYANLPSTTTTTPQFNASRYSPAPPTLAPSAPIIPPSQSRYSPAPPTQRQSSYTAPITTAQPQTPILPHLPRTSSPLAHFERSSREHRPYSSEVMTERGSGSSGYESNLRAHPLSPTREVDENDSAALHNPVQPPPNPYAPRRQSTHTPPPPQGSGKNTISPSKRNPLNYAPTYSSGSSGQKEFAPPRRSQTQSPGTALAGSRMEMNAGDQFARPASVHGPSSPTINTSPYSSISATSTGHRRGFSQNLNYVAPTDGSENDPLQRWRGAPVFAWGVGGSVITSFPKDVPRYGMGQSIPMVVRSPGEVKTRNIKDVNPLEEKLSSFPGPLKGKSKKKDVLSWLADGIALLEQADCQFPQLKSPTHEDKRKEERVLLWKILRVFIENDGVLEGNSVVDKSVRDILSPGAENSSQVVPLYATGADLSGITSPIASTLKAEPIDPVALDQIRQHLLRGDREKAVWEAVDKRLWAHALLMANTVSKDLYKQVAQEFIQKEVKLVGENTESLAALYEIFAGNFEESIDELVPPSARAGFRMVSTSNSSGPSKDALEGLDRWRETLGMVLSNRSTDDGQALNALGKLLSSYGRAEAAHICFLFARTYSVFGGVDDPLSSIVLVGSDHQRQPYDFDKELEPILLSEIYEYGLTLSNASVSALSMPHLTVYKLQHAIVLAENGYRDNALQYCEAIASSITSQTKRSPYHHALLVAALDDMSKRLKQSPKDESSSWISKPSIDKVSGSVWAKFNKFVAGDESDTAANGSATGGGSDVGPFARIAGGTPTLSRSPSNSEIYGSSGASFGMTPNGGIPIPQANKTASRYAPGGSYTPPSHEPQPGSSYGSQPRTSFEQRPSGELRRGPSRQHSDYRPTSQAGSVSSSYIPQTPYDIVPQAPYTPLAGNTESPYAEISSPYASQSVVTPITDRLPDSGLYSGDASDFSHSANPYNAESSDPRVSSGYQPPASNGYQPASISDYGPPSNSGYQPPSSSGYEPPTSTGYEPPSYQPASMDDELESPNDIKPKKKSFMDDDDDEFKPVPKPSGEKTKAEKDREADEAFRKAAEADSQRSKEAAAVPKKGWGLGGWFGGAKKEPIPDASQPGKPIRAKLGEASSFVYDPDLKRWVNKKGGTDNTPTPTPTPPPPRAAGPPRTASGPPVMAASVSRPPSTTGTPPMRSSQSMSDVHQAQADSASPTLPGLAAPPPSMSRSVSNGSMGGPPSRPSTSMSNASSIDDLLGPATGGRKGTAKGKKKGRGYIDVMGDKK